MVESQIYLYAMEDNDIEYTSNIYYLCMQWKIYTHAIRKTRYMYPLYRKQNVIKNVQTKFATFTLFSIPKIMYKNKQNLPPLLHTNEWQEIFSIPYLQE